MQTAHKQALARTVWAHNNQNTAASDVQANIIQQCFLASLKRKFINYDWQKRAHHLIPHMAGQRGVILLVVQQNLQTALK